MNFISISNKRLFTTKTHSSQKNIVVWKFTSLEDINLLAGLVFTQKGEICIWKVMFLLDAERSQFFASYYNFVTKGNAE